MMYGVALEGIDIGNMVAINEKGHVRNVTAKDLEEQMNHPRRVLMGAVFTLMATLALGQRIQTVTVAANPT